MNRAPPAGRGELQRSAALGLAVLLAGCPNVNTPSLDLSGEKLAQACQFYYGIRTMVNLINHPAINSAAAIIQAYLDPVCRNRIVLDADTADWVRRNATELETASSRVLR